MSGVFQAGSHLDTPATVGLAVGGVAIAVLAAAVGVCVCRRKRGRFNRRRRRSDTIVQGKGKANRSNTCVNRDADIYIHTHICSADGSTHTESNKLYRKVKHRYRPNLSPRQRPTAKARHDQAALAASAEARGATHRARPRSPSRCAYTYIEAPANGRCMLGGWVNPHREQQTIPQGQTSKPAQIFPHANGQSAPGKAALATFAGAPGATHRARPRSPHFTLTQRHR